MSAQQFCLRWNNHQPNFISVFSNLLHNETLVDVTLAAEGHHLQAHKVVLSACSSYFQSLFTVNPCQHPIVILKDIKFSDLKIMVDFMYYGEVNVSQDQLPSIIKTAESLKIKGLAEMHSGSSSKWPSDSRERGESCSPSSPQTPSHRRKRMRKSSTGSNSGSADKADDISEITLVATNTVKPEHSIASQETAENVRRPVNTNTESQGSIEEDQISIMSNMESNSTTTPVQSETPIQDLNQQPNSNMSQSSAVSQAQSHQETKIDPGFFDFMTNEMIKDMIPEVDLRYKFKLKYDEYKSKLLAEFQFKQQTVQDVSQPEIDPLKTNDQMDDFMDIEDSIFLESEKNEDPQKIESSGGTEKPNTFSVYSGYEANSMQSCSSYSEEVNSQLKDNNVSLKQLLIEDSTGREILKMYEKIGKVDRSKLATVIIRKETERDPDTRIRGDRFSYWAQEIATLFPNELKETYYIPYSRGPDGPLSARGILYTKYTNRRRSLRGKGILEPTKVRYKKNPLEFPAGSYEDDAEVECLEWLINNVAPAAEVIEKWTTSSRLRLSKLDNTSIEEHFERYKCLKEDFGHILIDIDFRCLHGDACDKLSQVWPDIALRIIAFSKKQANLEIKNFLLLYNTEIEEGNINIVALMLLPLLLKTVTMKSSFGDQTFRPTREHVQKNFIIHVNELSYIQPALEERKKFLTNYKLSDYPVPVFVGSMQEIKSAFVFIKNVQYRLESPLQAVETCFKIFFAVNTDYPKLCEHVWAFFEKYIFQIKRQHAPHYVSANSLASDLGLS